MLKKWPLVKKSHCRNPRIEWESYIIMNVLQECNIKNKTSIIVKRISNTKTTQKAKMMKLNIKMNI